MAALHQPEDTEVCSQVRDHQPHLTTLSTSAVVMGGKVYVIGGFDGIERLKSVECFTPGTNHNSRTWYQVPPPSLLSWPPGAGHAGAQV